jgi:arabinose-5-phosphate isomerase
VSLDTARRVLGVEAKALEDLAASLGEPFLRAVEVILAAKGRLVVTGMGKSGIVGRKIAATLASTGTPSFFLHPAEALHGDLGMVIEEDVVLALSNSGETEELLRLAPTFRRMKVPVIAITGVPGSGLAGAATVHLPVVIDREACPLGLAPMASTTAQMALGDALAAELMERRGFKSEDFARLHPGGKLGKKLMKVSELMHAGDDLPAVPPTMPMRDVIYEISRKRLGVAVVKGGDGRVAGIITDGDLRRLLERHGGDLLAKTAGECAYPNPATVSPDLLAAEALATLEKRKITSLVVADEDGKLLGVLHLHDLWGIQLI